MPRKARLNASGCLQFITSRGVDQRKLFEDDQDRNSILKRFTSILEEIRTLCVASALMPDHFYMLLRTSSIPLEKIVISLEFSIDQIRNFEKKLNSKSVPYRSFRY